MESLVSRNQFIGLDSCTWLYSGAETPTHRGCLDHVMKYLNNKSLGPQGRELHSFVEHECKMNIAALLHAKPEDIAFLSNSSEAICAIALSLDLKSGDNVVINTLEFPSGVLPWLRLKEIGIEVRVVQHKDWQVSISDIISRVDERTRLVITSHVSYLTGARLDYKQLYSHIQTTNALLLLDATQSLGAVPVDLNHADFIVSSSYKWLLSMHGLGILAINPRRTQHIRPFTVGWRSVANMFSEDRFESFELWGDARKFETGYPSYSTIYSMHFSSKLLLDIGIEETEKYILALGTTLIERLTHAGYEVMTPIEPEQRAGNVCIVHPEGEQEANRLRKENVLLWGGDNRLRASVHLFNNSSDIERLMELLE
ncbi:aminotransferase class V-fold PLP-dependent enzyme [Paenibacillus koleovorans]|uniref:aminotransferase class V-fold PLP-dependent enzyme n=1 Tax=Paenibacillus koleovorans TaxID=121608 RepID=UPI0013E35642|nr:aminotransferase class V-fold PLP-dependent enzyme [Paenibacillus koleovorans]